MKQRSHKQKRITAERECSFNNGCLLYTSDAADERSSVDLGGRRIIKKKTNEQKRNHAGYHAL